MQRQAEYKRKVIESQMMALQTEIEIDEEQLQQDLSLEKENQKIQVDELSTIIQARQGNGTLQGKE